MANRNFIIHQYDEMNRELTWLTLVDDLPIGKHPFRQLIKQADTALADGHAENSTT